MALVAVAGIQHETNTFAPTNAGLDAFKTGGSRPPLTTGPDLFSRIKGKNLPIAGFVERIEALDHIAYPLTWGAAAPSDMVTEHAFEHIAGLILEGLESAPPYDAVYLCLHGAMVTEHLEDGEGELLRRVRDLIGPEMPLVSSLDLHSNTTPLMIEHADLLVAYRTYPHVDMADTGARTAGLLDEMLRRGAKPAKAFRQIPFLIPLNWQCTMMQPAQGVYERMAAMEGGELLHASFTPGFPAADIHHCGPSVFTYGWSEAAAAGTCERLARDVVGLESAFAGRIYDPDGGVQEAMRLAETATRPIVIADTQDNPGAGGDSNTAGMLRAFIENRADGAALGLIRRPRRLRIAPASVPKSISPSAAIPGWTGMSRLRRSTGSRNCTTVASTRPGPSTREQSSISALPPVFALAAPRSCSRATRCRWRIRRCSVSSASSRPNGKF